MKNTKREPKVVLVGDSAAGKTSLLIQIVRGSYDPTIESTVGASYESKTIETSKGPLSIRFWDTAGQEKFKSLIPMYIRNSSVVILVINSQSVDSFNSKDTWVQQVRDISPDTEFYILSNKSDLPPMIPVDELKEWAEKKGFQFYRVSAKDNVSVMKAINTMAESLAYDCIDSEVYVTPEVKVEQKGCCS